MKSLLEQIEEAGAFDSVEFLRSYFGTTNVSAVEACERQHAQTQWQRDTLKILLKAIDDSIARADDYGDSYNSAPIREARKEIAALVPKGDHES